MIVSLGGYDKVTNSCKSCHKYQKGKKEIIRMRIVVKCSADVF